MYKKYNDQELLRLLSLDKAEAFEEIYNRFAVNMFLYASNILKKKEVCEDIVQNIFVDLWSKREDLKITNLSSYLFRAVKYQVFNHFRNRKFTSENLIRLNIIDISIDISKKMEYDELEKIIDSYVDELPSRCKQIFLLSRYQHKSNKEIAEELEISLQAVKNQISKALNYIRRNLQQEELAFCFVLLFR
ncbi:MAG: RNA polymerase sigma-70 factor [Flavobacteriaceae bacterium]